MSVSALCSWPVLAYTNLLMDPKSMGTSVLENKSSGQCVGWCSCNRNEMCIFINLFAWLSGLVWVEIICTGKAICKAKWMLCIP